MKFDKFEIQYLPGIFPIQTFNQTFSANFEIIASENLTETESTSDKWFATIDSDAINRDIQTKLNTRYTCSFLASENIDFGILASAGTVTAVTDIGTMTLFDVEVEKELIELTRTYKVTLSFTRKGVANIASFLDTENIEELTGGNTLTYEVAEPAYTSRVDIGADGHFTIVNDLGIIDNIEQNDYLYCHSNEINVNSASIDLPVVKCVLKTTSLLSFEPLNVGIRTVSTNTHIQLDFNKDRVTEALVVPRLLSVVLYTMLQPKLSLIEPVFSDEINIQSGIKKYTNAVTGNILNCLFYVTEADLWKLNYMNYANSAIFAKGATSYYADFTAGIITQNERTSLLELFEAELLLPYNTLSANIK